jgi:hypothetical protein
MKTTPRSKSAAASKKTTARSSSATSKKTPPRSTGTAVSKKTPARSSRAAAPKKAATGLSNVEASKKIDKRIEELGDWRGVTLARLRKLIHEADPEIQEEWKWMGTPCWYRDGGVCTGESYKEVVKLTFFRGAALEDPKKLFNSSLEGNVRRAIDFREGEKINETAFKALIREAIAANAGAVSQRSRGKKKA